MVDLPVDGSHRIIEHCLEDVECIVWVGDQISVIAGIHLGLQRYVVEKWQYIQHILTFNAGAGMRLNPS